jgi:titin
MSRRFNSQQEMLHALKMQAMYNANQSNPKSRISTAGHTNPPEIYAQQNAISQQINAIVKGNANFKIPGEPTGVLAEVHNGYVTLTWTAPVETGGTPITGYSIQARNCYSGSVKTFVSNGAGTGPYKIYTSEDDTPSTIQVRTPTVSDSPYVGRYTFSIASVNTIGKSLISTDSSVACQRIYMNPDAPTLTKAVAGFDGTADLTWTAPALYGGLLKTDVGWTYRISVTPAGGSANTTRTLQSPDQEIDYTVSGLTNGTSYTFAIRLENTSAPNEDAISPYSNTDSGNVPGAPKKPTNLDGTSGSNEKVSLTWIASDTPDGSPITAYAIIAYDYTLGAYLPPVPAGTGTSYDYEGITNGQAYAFSIRATNANGVSPYSTSAGPYTPYTVPVAPGAVSAYEFSDNYAVTSLVWIAPASNGGNEVTDYTIQVYLSDNTLLGTIASVTEYSNYDPLTPTSLTLASIDGGWGAGDVIYFKVAAKNLAGTGPYVTSRQYGPPISAPPSVSATFPSDYSSATVSWSAPSNNGGIALTQYHVQMYRGSDDSLMSDFNIAASFTSATIAGAGAGLSLGDVVYFKVAAKNPAGDGPFVTSVQYGPPNVPTSLAVNGSPPIDGTVTLSFTPPTDTGNISPITGYVVLPHNVVGGTDLPTQSFSTSDGAVTVVTGLTNGTAYTFKVAVVNYAGQGAYSSSSDPVTPYTYPDPPTGVSATGGDGYAEVSWTPGANKGSAISGYTVVATDTGDSSTITQTATSSPYTFDGLANGHSYRFKVLATNTRGNSSYSDPSSITKVGPPGKCTLKYNVAYGGQPGTAALYWNKGSGPVATSYISRINDKTAQTYTTTEPIPNLQDLGDSIYYPATGLIGGHIYTFQVTAVNEAGPGPISDETSSYTAYGTPLAVGMPTVTWGTTTPNGNYGVTVSWTPNTSDPNTASYRIKFVSSTYGYSVTADVPAANTSTYTGTSMNVADYNGTTYKTVLYGPHNGNRPPNFYDIKVVGVTPAYAEGSGTFNTNDGNHWVTY